MPDSVVRSSKMSAMLRTLVVGVTLAVTGTAGAQCHYEYTIIPYPTCGGDSVGGTGLAINEHGVVAGKVCGGCFCDYDRPYRWSSDTGFDLLPSLPGAFDGAATGISDDGIIVGYIDFVDDDMHSIAFRWNGRAYEFVIPPETSWSTASRTRSGRFLAGSISGGDGTRLPMIEFDDAIHVLEPLFGESGTTNYVNQHGHFVGWMGDSLASVNAFPFVATDPSTVTLLPRPEDAHAATALAMNNDDQCVVLAYFDDPDSTQNLRQSWLFMDGEYRELPRLPGHELTTVRAINEHGVMVGTSQESHTDIFRRAVIWRNGEVIDLNDLIAFDVGIYMLRDAHDINDRGQILCETITDLTVVLTPVDVPLGDVDCDGVVGPSDLTMVLEHWGTCMGCASDLNHDQDVGVADLLSILGNWSG